MKVLITGGLGMIGSCLAARCVMDGHNVIVYDNEETGSEENLTYHLGDRAPEVQIIKGDVLNRERLAETISSVHLCYHMAATLGTLKVVHHPRHMMRVNIIGTQNVVDLCLQCKVPVIVASTSMVYGNNPAPVVREDDQLFVEGDLCKGLWWYAVSKIADEAYAHSAMLEEQDARLLIVRPFNVVAPVQRGADGFVLPRFIRAALRNEPLLVYGDGSQRRTFLWVSDFVNCLVRLVDANCWNDTVNIGNTEELTILELAKLVVRMSNSRSEIRLVEPQSLFRNQFAEIHRRIPDLSKLLQVCKPGPFISIEEIVQRFLDYHALKAAH